MTIIIRIGIKGTKDCEPPQVANSQYYTLTLYSVERCTRLCVHGREKNEDTGNDVGDMAVDIQLRPYTSIWG